VTLTQTVRVVAALNLAYFGIEFAVALHIGSVALFADSVDFLEDTAVNFLIFAGLGWTARNRARLGMGLAAILLVPGLATLWTAWEKISLPVAPSPLPLSLTGLGALAINLSCALMLVRHRNAGGSLTRAAFLSARNDAFANVAIIAAGGVTAFLWRSAWPDLVVGLAIAAINATPPMKSLPQPGGNTPTPRPSGVSKQYFHRNGRRSAWRRPPVR
jgi:Co/Zn/Cd efflux system component